MSEHSEFKRSEREVKTHKLIDLMEDLRQVCGVEGDFNFSILVEQNPIKKTFHYVAKVLAIVIRPTDDPVNGLRHASEKDRKLIFIHYDEIQKHSLNYVEFKETLFRKIPNKNNPFFISGNSALRDYQDNKFIEYELIAPDRKETKMIAMIRDKYDIEKPHVFKSEKLTLEL